MPVRPVKSVTEDQYRKLIVFCTNSGWYGTRDAAIFAVLWSTGLRRTELANLVLDDVNLKEAPSWSVNRRTGPTESRTRPPTPASICSLGFERGASCLRRGSRTGSGWASSVPSPPTASEKPSNG